MLWLKKIFAAFVLPPTSLVLLVLGGLWLSRRHPRAGRGLAALAATALLLASLPLVSDHALQQLESLPPITADALARGQVIVILGGGSYYGAPEYGGDTVSSASLERCRYGARLARESGLPVLVTGGVVWGGRAEGASMAEVLKEFGVNVRFVEDQSRDTRENARYSAALLKAAGLQRVILVSHASHLPRAAPLFEAEGLAVTAAPTAFSTAKTHWLEALLPSATALQRMSIFLHEWLGKRLA